MKKITILLAMFFLLVSTQAFSQFGMQEELIKIKTYQSFDKVYTGSEFKIAIEIDVDEGWHINSHKPYDDYLIPTEVVLPENPNFALQKVVYPEPKDFKLAFSVRFLLRIRKIKVVDDVQQFILPNRQETYWWRVFRHCSCLSKISVACHRKKT